MRNLLTIIVSSMALFGAEAVVKKADVTLLVNDVEKHYEAGKKFHLDGGDIVCFKEGKGRVVITADGWRKQISSHTKGCKHLPVSGEEESHLASHTAQKVIALFSKAEEEQVAGVSRKSSETQVITKPILLTKDTKYILIENDTWGPLPVTLTIYDEKKQTVENMANNEDILTSFVVPRAMLKKNYLLRVTNSFGDVLLESKVK